MAAPTQVLPSWLTLSTTVVTLPDGSVSTSSTTLTLPLTYYGPSIPLGTNGVWTYGGLTPPPSTTSPSTSATPTSSSSLSSVITSAPPTSSTLAPTSTFTSSASSSTSAIPTATPAAGSSHGISPSVLGAILGSILGTLLLLILVVILLLLRRSRRRRLPESDPHDPSSSFWNRSTTMQSLRHSHQPIWTGWESIDAHDADPSPSPGDGSPRESGDEADPFLTRGSVRSGTEAGHARTDTDTLVSLPAIARPEATSSHRSKTKLGEPIIPRDVQLRMGEEMADVPPYPSIRVVERRPSTDVESPLLPPRPIDPDSLGISNRRPSLAEKRSIGSEKSLGSIDPQEAEGAEMLTARRVRVGPLQPGAPSASTSVATPNLLGLGGLAANLPRMSWFRRMSSQFSPRSEQDAASPSDAYTRTPPRHSRYSSRSRPGSQSRPDSFARVSTHEPTSPTTDSFGRRLRHQDSGLGFGGPGERPISTVSGASAASGTTVFFDARSRPGSSMGTHSTQGSGSTQHPPVPPVPAAHYPQPSPLQREVRQSTSSNGHSNEYLALDSPPTYEAATRPQSMVGMGMDMGMQYSDIDVLDMPAPRPASPFSAASGSGSGSRSIPPGLPSVSVWRSSVVSSSATSPTTAVDTTSGIGINLDVLDEAPPSADNGWSSLSGGGSGGRQLGRRLTFGTPMVVQPRDMLESERGSLHSMRSHLSPYSSQSPTGSAAASSHTLSGSGSSRPSASLRSHSRGHTGSSGQSLAHSASTSFDDHRPGRRRVLVGEVAAPLSAVISGFPYSISPPSSSSHGEDVVAPLRVFHTNAHAPTHVHSSVPVPTLPMPAAVAVSGTMASRATTTDESLTDLSVTTTQTDPITGAVMHFPRLPLRTGNEGTVRDDALW